LHSAFPLKDFFRLTLMQMRMSCKYGKQRQISRMEAIGGGILSLNAGPVCCERFARHPGNGPLTANRPTATTRAPDRAAFYARRDDAANGRRGACE